PLIVALDRSVSQLDEVQYIAYGTQSKRYSVGNVSSVKASDIEKQPVQNPLLTLQGRVPGLLVTQNTGLANGGFTVQIQGRNSITRGNDPLIVVDGVPLAFELYGAQSLGGPLNVGDNKRPNSPINFINPLDIEAIDVLKDADATAIYGSRAANGAILITTKKGKSGKTRVTVGVQQGWSRVGRTVDMLNTRQYLDMRYEAIKNEGLTVTSRPNYDLRLWDTTRYTNWQKELIGGTAKNTNLTASVSGGTATIQYLVGGTLNRNTNVFPGSFANKTGNIHFNVNASSLNQRFKLGLTGSYAVNNNGVPETDLTKAALLLAPNAPPLYNEDGTLNWAPNEAGSSTFNNPLGGIVFQDYEHAINALTSNAQISYSILPGLNIKSSFGYNNIRGNSFFASLPGAYPPEDRNNFGTGPSSSFSNINSFSWIAEPQLTFNRVIGKISLDALAGSTFQKDKAEVYGGSAEGFINDLLVRNFASATSVRVAYNNTIYRYNALFGRLNMIVDKKYMMNLTARRDGSSRFGENNLFHNFWSAGAGWIFTEEKAIENALSFLSFGKLRCSYGTTGSDGIGDYQYLNAYFNTESDMPYQGTTGISTTTIGNPYLQWEETRKLSGGVDLGFFKDRVLLNITYQRNRSSNQLITYPLPSITGVYGLPKNLPATVQNTSLEFSLVTDNIKAKDFAWTTNVNLTVPHNKVVEFPGIEETSYANGMDGVIVGQPLGVRKYYHYLGIDPSTGLYAFANENKQPVLGLEPAEARNVIISTQPTFYGGLANTLSYKGFSLDFLFQFIRQKGARALYFWNELVLPGTFFDEYGNQPVSVLNRWQKPCL
ncbi:MAG: SusC/RagA family TonB-linked outer membrane protein, partial [Chitinophagaceae bacterium]|nr:SusC/RagA family TonB-linked outer membrane protein [Chitinophagaceae bacterium]